MSIELITLFMFGSLVVLLLAGVPIAFVTGSVAAVTILYLWGPNSFFLIVSHTWSKMTEFSLAAIPLFIFMANIPGARRHRRTTVLCDTRVDRSDPGLAGRIHDYCDHHPGRHGRDHRRRRGADGTDRPAGHAPARLQ